MTYNASAYPSGMRNRKANTGKNKGKTYTFDECKDVPIDDVPMSKFPVVKNVDFPEIADVYMSYATQPITSTEGKMLGAAASSTEVDRSGSVGERGWTKRRGEGSCRIPECKISLVALWTFSNRSSPVTVDA